MTGDPRLPWEELLDRAGVIMVVLDREGKILRVNEAGARLLGARPEELIGRDWFAEFVPPQREPELRRVFSATLKGDTAHVNTVRSLTGEERTIVWRNAPLPEPGTGVVALGIDITDRVRLEGELKAALEDARRRLNRLTALRKIDKSIIASRSLEETAQLALEAIPPELGADAVALTLLEGPERRPVLFRMRLPNGTLIREEAFQLTAPLLAELLEGRETVAVPDLEADPRVQVHLDRIRSEGLRSYLGVPLVVQGRVVGVLHVLSKSKQLIQAEDVEFFRTLAGQVAIALESTRLTEELARSEREYRELFDMAPVGIYRATLDGRLLKANPALAELLGFPSPEALLEAVSDVRSLYVEPVRRDEFLQRLLVSRVVQGFKARLRRADGAIRWVSKNARLLRDPQGRAWGYEVVCLDITEEKKAEEVRERNWRRFQALLEHAPDVIALLDREGRITYESPSFTRIFGIPAHQVIGQPIWRFFHPEDLPQVRDIWQRLLARPGSSERVTWRVRLGTGEWRWVEAVVTNLLRDPAVQAVVVNYRDVTEQVRIQQEEARLRRRLELQWRISELADANVAALYRETLSGALELTESTIGVIAQLREGEAKVSLLACSDEVMERCQVKDKPCQLELMTAGLWAEPLRTGEPLIVNDYPSHPRRHGLPEGHLPIQRLLGVPIPVRGKGTLLVVVANKSREYTQEDVAQLRSFVSSVQVILERRAMEEELARSQQQLLRQERLRLVGQLASGVAHDINNALSPVLGYVDLLLQTEPDLSPRVREYLERVKQAGESIADTVQRLRNLYRPQAPTTTAPVDLNRIARAALDLARPRWKDLAQAQGRAFRVVEELSARAPLVEADEGELRDAVVNLVMNALDAMPRGGTLTVRTGIREGEAFLEVADTGVGMDEVTVSRAREPFFTTKGPEGTGLGLAVADRIAHAYGGRLELESTLGEGTRARLVFPSSASPPVPEEAEPPMVPPLRILVVEDEPQVQQLLESMLTGDGHTVAIAPHGEEGVRRFREAMEGGRPFDLVITDFGMPGMDGRQVAQKVKALEEKIRIVLLTGWGETLPEGGIPDQVDLTLTKPPRLAELRRALGALFSDPAAPGS